MAKYLGGGSGGGDDYSSGAALVKFTAAWCGPCRATQPAFLALAAGSPVACFEADIDEVEGGRLAEALGVSALPTFLLLRDGREVAGGRVVGAKLPEVRRLLEVSLAAER
jgi:thiol-disulfide isomerase/thioredoxin